MNTLTDMKNTNTEVPTSYLSGTNLDMTRNPVIKHWKEKNRYVTIAFTKDKINNLTAYGATVFHKCHDKETWNKKAHVHTAVSRLRKFPVIVENLPKYESKDEYNKYFFVNLRMCILKFGVRNHFNDTIDRFDWDMPGLIDI
jgi:hypothetical protein